MPIEKPERIRIDRLDVADEPQVHALAIGQPVRPRVGDDQMGVLAVETDRVAAVLVDKPHDRGVDATHQNHLHQLHRLVVGHAEAIDEARSLAEASHEGVDLGPSAVDDDGMDACGAKTRHVPGKGCPELVTSHRGAAVLDHYGSVAPQAQIIEPAQHDTNPSLVE